MKHIYLFLFSFFPFLSAMTVEEQIGQILMCPIHGEVVTKEIQNFLKETKIGGVILYGWANDLSSPSAIQNFTKSLQIESIKNTEQPLFIGIDQEGGRIDRLQLELPSAQALGNTNNPITAFLIGELIGRKLKALGINLNFAPVVDINSNAKNTVIKDRAFGKDPIKVTAFAQRFAQGLLSNGIFYCLKHYPGHGDVTIDSHYALPISNKTLKELMEMELIPYKEIPSPFVMTAHILFPNIDPDHPATLSKIFLQDILRNTLKHKGLIITDSLRMDGILTKSISEISIDAFNAGNDILLIGGNRLIKDDPNYNLEEVRTLHKELVAAAKDGRILKKRLEESLDRIVAAKKKFF